MDKCRLSRFFWGLMLIGLLTLLTLEFERSVIEEDLTQRTRHTLNISGLKWAKFHISGRDAYLSDAEQYDPFQRLKAMEAMSRVYGIRVVQDASKPLPLITPYQWSASRKKETIKLHGYVSSQADRKIILGFARANFPSFKIKDKMKFGSGLRDKNMWLAMVSFSLKQLRYVDKGRVGLVGQKMDFHGRAVDSESYLFLGQNLKNKMPESLKLASFSVKPPKAKPYVLTINASSAVIKLEGKIPDIKTREDILKALKRLLPGRQFIDKLEFASGHPKGWGSMIRILVEQIGKMKTGGLSFTDRAINIFGIVENQAILSAIQDNLKSKILPAYTYVERIKIEATKDSRAHVESLYSAIR